MGPEKISISNDDEKLFLLLKIFSAKLFKNGTFSLRGKSLNSQGIAYYSFEVYLLANIAKIS